MSEVNYTTRGQGNLNTVLGAIGTAGGIPEIVGGLFGGMRGGGWGGHGSYGGYGGYGMHEHLINRYEAMQQSRIAELESEVKLRDSNIYTDNKMLEMYKYFDGEIKGINQQLCAQAVMNQKTADSFDLVRNDLMCCKKELYSAIHRERDERSCADNAIVNYVNATFYPKMVADVTTAATTTAQLLYNPLPRSGYRNDQF
ncbi:MAG: hypothetical protein IJ017_04620 [Oscillospiraceae bacterium]|nr:hypothetical protein [Oscillospiraceae bacterium]